MEAYYIYRGNVRMEFYILWCFVTYCGKNSTHLIHSRVYISSRIKQRLKLVGYDLRYTATYTNYLGTHNYYIAPKTLFSQHQFTQLYGFTKCWVAPLAFSNYILSYRLSRSLSWVEFRNRPIGLRIRHQLWKLDIIWSIIILCCSMVCRLILYTYINPIWSERAWKILSERGRDWFTT